MQQNPDHEMSQEQKDHIEFDPDLPTLPPPREQNPPDETFLKDIQKAQQTKKIPRKPSKEDDYKEYLSLVAKLEETAIAYSTFKRKSKKDIQKLLKEYRLYVSQQYSDGSIVGGIDTETALKQKVIVPNSSYDPDRVMSEYKLVDQCLTQTHQEHQQALERSRQRMRKSFAKAHTVGACMLETQVSPKYFKGLTKDFIHAEPDLEDVSIDLLIHLTGFTEAELDKVLSPSAAYVSILASVVGQNVATNMGFVDLDELKASRQPHYQE